MILTKKVEVKIISHNIKHFLSLGYKFNYYDIIKIPIEHMTKGSNIKIKVKCDIEECGNIKYISYEKYKIVSKNARERAKFGDKAIL